MIFLLVTKRGSHTFRDYLQDWAGDLKTSLQLLLYEDFLQWSAATPGTYIFSDLERLTDAQMAIARDHADQLQREIPEVRILNHPQHAMCRRSLLDTLASQGANTFRAFPVLAIPHDIRYPLFLRMEREHLGPTSDLIRDMHGLRAEALRLASLGVRLDEFLAVEYCETRSPDGWYRKYSAFRIGDRIVPAHMVFSKHWVAKDGTAPNDALREEEAAYMRDDPHVQWLRKVFDLAHIQYGRIDYSMVHGQPQVWEINTNPILLKSRADYEKTAPLELPMKDQLARTIGACFESIHVITPTSNPSASARNIVIERFVRMIDPHPLSEQPDASPPEQETNDENQGHAQIAASKAVS